LQKTNVISIVIITRNEGAELEATVRNLLATASQARLEMIVVDDGSTDESTGFLESFPDIRVIRSNGIGVARARNLGATHASGDVIVFSDAHVRAPENWHVPMIEAFELEDVGACAPGIYSTLEPKRRGYGLYFTGADLRSNWHRKDSDEPAEVAILPGCFLGMRREVFQETGGYDPGMRQLGGNDNELSFRLWTLGYRLLVVPKVEVGHLFRTSIPYEATWSAAVHNRLRMAMVHFGPQRIERVVDALRRYDRFPAGIAMMAGEDHTERRTIIERRRRFDDDWYFDIFDLTC